MKQPINLKTPKPILARMQVARLGKITFNLQFLALAVVIASMLSFVATGLYYLVLAMFVLATLGLVFVAYPKFGILFQKGDTLVAITKWLGNSWKYTVPILLILSITSILCLSFDKNQKHVGKIVASVLVAIVAIAYLLFKLVNKGVVA